jgi:hypothetical protein
MAPSLIITGLGLDDWIYGRILLQSLLITINDCLRLAPFLTGLRAFSSSLPSTVTDLLLIYESFTSASRMNCERLPLYDWITNHSVWWTAFSCKNESQSTLHVPLPAFLSERPLRYFSGNLGECLLLVRWQGNLCFVLSWSLEIHLHGNVC